MTWHGSDALVREALLHAGHTMLGAIRYCLVCIFTINIVEGGCVWWGVRVHPFVSSRDHNKILFARHDCAALAKNIIHVFGSLFIDCNYNGVYAVCQQHVCSIEKPSFDCNEAY